MKHIVSYSGGKDSGGCICFCLEKGIAPEDIVVVFCDTGWETSLTYEYVNTVQKWCEDKGITFYRLQPVMQFEELVKHNKIFPTANARYCTRLMKIEPFFMFLSKFREEYFDFVVITGERAEESPSRAKKPEREYDDKYYHCEVWRPLKNWTAEEVFEAHIRNDFPINPMYNLGFSRVGCAPCIYARQADVALMAKHFPEQIDKVEALEASLEDTSTKETPFYYFSIGMKIREYVQHCNRKTAYGSIEDHLPPESICAAHYAILCE